MEVEAPEMNKYVGRWQMPGRVVVEVEGYGNGQEVERWRGAVEAPP